MNAGYLRHRGETHRWILTASGVLVVAAHRFTTQLVDVGVYSVSRVVRGKVDSFEFRIPAEPATLPPPPVMPLPKSKRARFAHQVSR